MVVITENELRDLRNRASMETTPTRNAMFELEKKMEDISLDKSIPPYERLKMYQELQQQYLTLSHKPKPSVPVHIVKATVKDTETPSTSTQDVIDPYKELLLGSVPSRMRNKASRLVQFLKQNPSILSWNNRGEMSYMGQPVEGTNIQDIIYSMYTPRSTHMPIGQEKFLRGLAQMNAPETLLSNSKVKQRLRAEKTSQTPNIPMEGVLPMIEPEKDMPPPRTPKPTGWVRDLQRYRKQDLIEQRKAKREAAEQESNEPYELENFYDPKRFKSEDELAFEEDLGVKNLYNVY